jgi:acetolactate synthase-1/2/3 large subunit
VTGDGGFMMSIQALSTAVQYEIPVTCVVLNDYSLGMVRQHQHARTIASEFFHHDHAELARAFGAHGIRVDDSRQLPAALREAQACDRATVIDVITDRAPSPDDYRAVARGATET